MAQETGLPPTNTPEGRHGRNDAHLPGPGPLDKGGRSASSWHHLPPKTSIRYETPSLAMSRRLMIQPPPYRYGDPGHKH